MNRYEIKVGDVVVGHATAESEEQALEVAAGHITVSEGREVLSEDFSEFRQLDDVYGYEVRAIVEGLAGCMQAACDKNAKRARHDIQWAMKRNLNDPGMYRDAAERIDYITRYIPEIFVFTRRRIKSLESKVVDHDIFAAAKSALLEIADVLSLRKKGKLNLRQMVDEVKVYVEENGRLAGVK